MWNYCCRPSAIAAFPLAVHVSHDMATSHRSAPGARVEVCRRPQADRCDAMMWEEAM
jgi:hypothetical protein